MMHTALIAALALTATPTFAQTAQDSATPRIAVQYSDLDLTSAHGRHMLDRRLRESAAEVCGYDGSGRANLARDDERACYNSALDHAHVMVAAAVNKSRVASSQ